MSKRHVLHCLKGLLSSSLSLTEYSLSPSINRMHRMSTGSCGQTLNTRQPAVPSQPGDHAHFNTTTKAFVVAECTLSLAGAGTPDPKLPFSRVPCNSPPLPSPTDTSGSLVSFPVEPYWGRLHTKQTCTSHCVPGSRPSSQSNKMQIPFNVVNAFFMSGQRPRKTHAFHWFYNSSAAPVGYATLI